MRLKVLKNAAPYVERIVEMDKDIILIGKDPKNELPLEDTNFVSRRHAKLVRSGDTYCLIDLGSRNGTILNGNRIKANLEYPLKNGDLIDICEFTVTFSAEQEEIKPEEKPSAGPAPAGLFTDESRSLVAALIRLCQGYDAEESSGKNEALQEALGHSLEGARLNAAADILSQVLIPQAGRRAPVPPEEQPDQRLDFSSGADRIERAVSILLDFFVKMIQALDQFETFFLDKTMTSIILGPKSAASKSGKAFSVHRCTPEELKAYLFDPAISPQEAQARIQCIQANAEKLMIHQISLLAGYEASVIEGTQQILQKMSPQGFQRKLEEKTAKLRPFQFLYRLMPMLSAVQIVKELSRAYQELALEDPAKIEEAYFHKPYKLGYQKSMNKIPDKNVSSD